MTVLRFERYPVDASSTEAFAAEVATLVAAMRAAPGALWADAAQAADDAPSTLVLSEWRTAADEDAWSGSPDVDGFAQRVDPFLRGEPTIRRFSA